MAQTLLQIQRQIATLQADAERLRKVEAKGVIANIREAIEAYGLTAEELFDAGARSVSTGSARRTTAVKMPAGKSAQRTKYADGQGNEWGGRGPRPAWLRQAIDSGKSLEDFAVMPQRRMASKSSASVSSKATDKRKTLPVKFRDDSGNTWTGRGSTPRWLRAAMDGGRSLEQFQV